MPAFFNTKPMAVYDCLTNIIGITRSDDEEVAEALANEDLGDDWYKKTTSGLYIDELEGMIGVKAVDESKEMYEELATFFVRGRDNAIADMTADLLTGLIKRAINGHRKYTGNLGGKSFNGVVDINGIGYAGVKIYTVPMRGGSITISKVYAMMNADAVFDIAVYKIERGSTQVELVTTIPGVQSQANTLKINVLATPVTLDLSLYGADFFLLYQPAGFLPKQNSNSCGCGYKENILRNYLFMGGVSGNDVNALPYFQGSNFAMGLAFEAEVGCDTSKIICEAYNNSVESKTVMAYTARFRAAQLVLEYVLKSDELNRYTLSQREGLYGKRNTFRAEYNDRIAWLVENLDITLSDCYICNDKHVRKGGIVV